MDATTSPPPFPPPDPAPHPAPGTTSGATRPTRTRSAGHVVAIVFGCLLLLPGLGMLAGGGAAALAQTFATDDDGYFRVTLDRVETDGAAIASTDLVLDADMDGEPPTWFLDALDVDVRLRVDGARADDELFVGIARSADVEDYLDGVAHAEVVELRHDTPRTIDLPGTASIEAPSTQDFWLTSASAERPEVEWEARGGRWSVVVMNADASPGVTADVEVGIRSGAIAPVATTLMVVGTIVLAGGIVLLVIGIRGRRSGDDPAAPAAGHAVPHSPQPPATPSTPTTPSADPVSDTAAGRALQVGTDEREHDEPHALV